MVGGGVEPTGRGVQFASEFHADEHFAASFVVVAGGGEDGGDGLRSGAVLQEVEDGLSVWGGDRASAETCQVGALVFTEPVQGGDALGGEAGVVGEDGGLWAEEMVGGEQEAVVLVVRIGGKQEAATDGLEDRRRWGRRAQGVSDGGAEGADEQDGAVGLLGQFSQGGKAAGETGHSTGGIEDEQTGVHEADDGG